ncbi:MAG TPA: MBG domain-containing protein, partial [Chloroflexota bacterium]|nr:MBG domain-containing protein [Chloroflexota bacterium]
SHVAASPYTITASGAADSDYSPVSYTSGKLTVTPAPLTITPNNQTKTYGAPLPVLSLSFTGFVNGDSAASLGTAPALSTTASAASHVSSYPITASGAVDADYAISYGSGSLKVTPAVLTITAKDASRTYGAANPAFQATYSGFVLSDGPSSLGGALAFSTPATPTGAVAGSPYAVTPGGLISTDYAISFVAGKLTITKAPLTVAGNSISKVIGLPIPALGGTTTGLLNGDNISTTYTTTATQLSAVGSYPITPSAVDPNNRLPNYALTLTAGTLTVTANTSCPRTGQNGANLAGANLSGCNLANYNFNKANLANAIIVGANFKGANLNMATLTGAFIANTDFSNANLNKADLTGAKQTNNNFTDANMHGVKV